MRRRAFIGLIGSAAALAAGGARAGAGAAHRRAAAHARRRCGGKARLTAFQDGLAQLGWIDGRNMRIDVRWSGGSSDETGKQAAELAALAPDVILAHGNAAMAPLRQATRTVPLVFAIVPDPVGAGFVSSLARPGGNATGFTPFEFSIGGKWLELLKEIAPGVKRAAILRDADIAAGIGQFGAIQSAAPALGLRGEPGQRAHAPKSSAPSRTSRARANGGLIVTGSTLASVHRDPIIAAAARHKLPAVYYGRFFVPAGGLISYGPDLVDQFRRAAGYVDRILKGEKPADLPVQAPTKFELVINLKTAKALGLTVPPSLLARADEVIE